jgi:hypothetical protein
MLVQWQIKAGRLQEGFGYEVRLQIGETPKHVVMFPPSLAGTGRDRKLDTVNYTMLLSTKEGPMLSRVGRMIPYLAQRRKGIDNRRSEWADAVSTL